MLCPECYGAGGFIPYEPGLFCVVCTYCRGFGIIHCCEGDQTEPALSERFPPAPPLRLLPTELPPIPITRRL